MKKLWAQPLRRQLFIAMLLLLVPVLVAVVWSGVVTMRERANELRDQTRVIAVTTATYVNRDFVNLDRITANLAGNAAVKALNVAGATDVLTRVLMGRPAIAGVLLADAASQEVTRVEVSSSLPPDAVTWATQVVRTGGRVVSPLQAAPPGGHPYIVIGYPVRDEGSRTVAALTMFVNPETLQDAFASLPLPDGSVVTITDASGRILARSREPEPFVGELFPESVPTPFAARPSEPRAGLDGVERMYSEALVESGPWMVSVGIPMTIARDAAASLWVRTFAILGLGLAGWLTIAFVMSRRLAESMSHLDAEAQRIAAGDFKPLERRPMASRECEELQDAFDRMLSRFNETRGILDSQMGEERRMRQELQSLQRQVIRQERLAAVGQLVSGVAHEINNPLQAILGFAELLQMQGDVPESVKTDLRLIQKESARACGIIRNLALFARQQTGEAAPVRLTDVITSVAELRQRRLETEDIELRVEDGSRQHVLAVLAELQQVVLNFVVNAEQAIVLSGRQPGRITVRTRDEGERVILEVEDTGPGVPADHEARLFQPFFTTKPVGQGTGLGLSVSYGIIESLGGRIGYRRAPAGGALFYVDLPAAAA